MALIVTILFHLFLMYVLQIQGSSVVTDVFVQTGEDLVLKLTAEIPPGSVVWAWQLKNEPIITFIKGSEPTIQTSHTGRIDVIDKKSSVKLKNLQKSDSGIYTANVITPQKQILTQYNVTVQDLVSPANLTLNSKSNTSSCIVTVTCRTDNSSISITLRCEDSTCNQEGGESRRVTKSGASLCIYQLKELIICNHSNQVSKSESTLKIADLCSQHSESRHRYWLILLIPVFLLLPILFRFCFVHRRCKKGAEGNVDNTIYACPAVNGQTKKTNETAEEEVHSPTTTYSTVGHAISNESNKTRGNNQPETLYSHIK